MSIMPLSTSNSDAQNYNEVNKLITEFKSKEVTQIFKDDTGTRRVLLGKGKDGFYGLKVSDPGVDVYEASDDQLVFNSDQNVFKIVASGTLVIAEYTATTGASQYASNSASQTVAHGLGYAPAVLAFVQIGPTYVSTPYTFTAGVGTGQFALSTIAVAVDTTNVEATSTTLAFNKTGGHTVSSVTIKYYLLQETAN